MTPAEELTYRFHEWELRGRGWQLWGYPVELEPPFVPFIGHFVEPRRYKDDARQDTASSLIIRLVKKALTYHKRYIPPKIPTFEEYDPDLFFPEVLPVEFQCSIPVDNRIHKEAAERLIHTFPQWGIPTCFEIIGTADQTIVQFATHHQSSQLKGHIRSYFPDVVVREDTSYLVDEWDMSGDFSIVIDFGLSEEFMLPINSFGNFDLDPLIAVIGALENLEYGEIGVLQVLFSRTYAPWAQSVINSVTDWDGKPFFVDAPELAKLAAYKVSQPLFAVNLRIGVRADSERRMWEIARLIGGSLTQFSTPTSNSFIPLENEGYDDEIHELDFLMRTTRRSGMILGSDELVSLVHLPSSSVRSNKLVRETKKTKAAPRIALNNEAVLGVNYHEGHEGIVSLNHDQRTRHTHIIGASGTGKSHLLLNLLIQDLEAGNGFAILDPHGDLIDRLMPYVPQSRLDDVILFDPADEQYPIGFNILQAHSTLEKQLLSSDLVAVFKRLSTSWGDQMTSVLGNAILAFLESREGGTLADMRRFLVEKEFRKDFLKTVTDHEVLYYWQKEFPLLSGRPQAPLLTRLDTFLRPRLIRHIVAQKENKLDFGHIMNSGKILLAKLAQGAIGEENSYLLGSLLVSKFYQLALSRQELQEASRKPFYLYIDEFHHFLTPTLSTILSGARKYRLGLTLAHQDMRQLQIRDTELQSAILTNPYTRICFRVGDMDTRALESGFSYFEAKDLQNLGRGEAVVRVERTDYDFNLETLPLPDLTSDSDEHTQVVIERSRQNNATPLAEVEELLRQAQAPIEEEKPHIERPSRKGRESLTLDPEKPIDIAEEEPKKPIITPPPKQKTAEASASKKSPKQESQVGKPKLGKGGQQHRYLQELINRWGQHNGFQSSIEKQILDGLGGIDVALENDEVKVACEISVTSKPEYEFGNVQKCLAAGYDHVIVVSADEKTLRKVEKHITGKLDEKDLSKVKFLAPEPLFDFLGTLPNSRTEQTIGGYKVQVKFKHGSKEEDKARKEAMNRVIFEALKRMKGFEITGECYE